MADATPLKIAAGEVQNFANTDSVPSANLGNALLVANNLSDLASAVTARTNLGAPFILFFFSSGASLADATTYYMSQGDAIQGTSATNFTFSVGYAFTIIGANIGVSRNTTAGTTESMTLKINNATTATVSTIGTFRTDGSTTICRSTTFTGLNISIAATDLWCPQTDSPTWATNPVGQFTTLTLFCIRN